MSYYQQCFETADASKSGRIQGDEAVTFMMRSGVHPGILKEVGSHTRTHIYVLSWGALNCCFCVLAVTTLFASATCAGSVV